MRSPPIDGQRYTNSNWARGDVNRHAAPRCAAPRSGRIDRVVVAGAVVRPFGDVRILREANAETMNADTTKTDIAAIVPALPRGVRFRFDESRGQWFLLGPERVFEPDETAVEILQRVDGVRSIAAIAQDLAMAFEADRDEIASDVTLFLRGLADQRMIDL